MNMDFIARDKRSFDVSGPDGTTRLTCCGTLHLDPDELISFRTESGGEYDVVRKSWGFYATPSLNARLPANGFCPVLALNPQGKLFVLLMERGKEEDFSRYLDSEKMLEICRLDSDAGVKTLVKALGK